MSPAQDQNNSQNIQIIVKEFGLNHKGLVENEAMSLCIWQFGKHLFKVNSIDSKISLMIVLVSLWLIYICICDISRMFNAMLNKFLIFKIRCLGNGKYSFKSHKRILQQQNSKFFVFSTI